jgi:hypothetical protein
VANFKLKKIKDEPIGKLIRPIKLYKGFIFPNEIKKNKNFSEWFSSSVRLQCRFQSTKEAVTSYKIFSKSLDKNIIKQYKELSLNDTIDHNKILNGYAAEITGFIYFYKKEYHLCKSKKEEAAIIKKIKNGNINILFVIVKLYKNVDLKKEKGLEEWDYHSTESFELIYPVKQTILLNYILKIESVMPGQSLKSTKQEYIVLSKERKDNLNIIYNSLSFYKIFCLGQHLMKNVNFNTYYSILD